jgi:cation diffusion facilitator CzcD-associated flavoprotein CzcO
MSTSTTEVAIIGAGPNGLGLAAHLRQRGVAHRIFGLPMQTWRDMPKNMNLKSLGFATSIPSPDGRRTFPEYCRANGLEDYEPIEFATFAQYGLAFQRELVPQVEETLVTELKRSGEQFVLKLAHGELVRAARVVVAVGLTYFPRIPEVLATLPPDRLAHTWGPKNFAAYTGKEVVVVGGGSSALETAALLHEHGAGVRVLVRRQVYWGTHGTREWERSWIERVRMPITTLGHGRENWVLQHIPWLMYYAPEDRRVAFTRRHLGPAPAWWLRERVDGKIEIRGQSVIQQAQVKGDKVVLRVRAAGADAYELEADQVVAGTGYEADVDRIAFIDKDLAGQIGRIQRAPQLSAQFESSVRGLYFLGPVAAFSFGPLVRFVAGAEFAVPVLAGHLTRQKKR